MVLEHGFLLLMKGTVCPRFSRTKADALERAIQMARNNPGERITIVETVTTVSVVTPEMQPEPWPLRVVDLTR